MIHEVLVTHLEPRQACKILPSFCSQACYPGEDAGYLVDAMGLLYREVTASNLVCVDLEGRVLDPGSTQLGVDRAGWVLHSLIHGARRDVKCVVHVSSTSTVAVSCFSVFVCLV